MGTVPTTRRHSTHGVRQHVPKTPDKPQHGRPRRASRPQARKQRRQPARTARRAPATPTQRPPTTTRKQSREPPHSPTSPQRPQPAAHPPAGPPKPPTAPENPATHRTRLPNTANPPHTTAPHTGCFSHTHKTIPNTKKETPPPKKKGGDPETDTPGTSPHALPFAPTRANGTWSHLRAILWGLGRAFTPNPSTFTFPR